MDKYRLVMPPALFLALAIPFWKLAHGLFFYNWHAATAKSLRPESLRFWMA